MIGLIVWSYDALAIATSIIGVVTAILSVMIALMRQRQMQARYDREHQHAVLSMLRESYEDKIADLNSRLLATEDRWKDVNHLLLDSQRKQPNHFVDSKIDTSRFLKQFGIDPERTDVESKLIFMLTPFNQRESGTFRAVHRVAQRFGFRCVRGDEEFVPDEILPHVVGLMVRARIIVANINGRNPNVYYELGIAHALGKPTILISRSLDSIPFDLRAKYVVLFEKTEELEERLRDAITRLLAEAEVF
jgi:hypothetical protein